MLHPPDQTARCAQRARAGFTLIEVLIAISILALISINIVLVSKTGTAAARTGALLSTLNGELDLTMERMELALMAAHSDEVQSVNAFPLYSNRVDFAIDIGVDNGSVVLGDPERIQWAQLNERDGAVSWLRNPDDVEAERAVTWSRAVPTVFDGETAGNGEDDNANGLLDEGGLAFTLPAENQDMLEIHLTVERTDKDGKRVPRSRRVRVTCRN
ncbi:MAG: prepilin-type N-terminal cleavage/methylation domain-containing protein [Planctomycetota bacterium]